MQAGPLTIEVFELMRVQRVSCPPVVIPVVERLVPRSVKILLVDDEPSFRAVVEEILRLQGHTVVCTACVKDALEALRHCVPDLILTDVMMPDIDGLTFLRTIRSFPAWAHIPVIVLTARSSPTDLSEAALAGATSLLTKPFSAAELRHAIAPFMPTGVG